MTNLRGLGTALITPFKEDYSVDYPALTNLVERQIQSGVDYIVVLGTTGESVTLSLDERRQVREHIANVAAGRVPLVLGAGGNCTDSVVSNIKHTDLSAFAAILSVCPYYNKPSQEGLFRHFSMIADASPIPIILYNVPGRTGVNMLPDTVVRLFETYPEQIAGIKEASGNVKQILEVIERKGSHLVISGDDGITSELMAAGADGLISVASNAFTEDFKEIVYNKSGRAAMLQEHYTRMVELLFKEGNPAGIKTVLSMQGLIKNILRLPLVSNSQAVQQAISKELLQLQ